MSFKSLRLSDDVPATGQIPETVPDILPPDIEDEDPLLLTPLEYRERTLHYDKHLPYPTETPQEALEKLQVIVERLFISVESKDLYIGAVNASLELTTWLSLKFDLPAETHVRLVRVYYDLCLSTNIHRRNARQFMSMFIRLASYRDLLRPGHLILDWRPIWKIIHVFLFEYLMDQHVYVPYHLYPSEIPLIAITARRFFDPAETPKILELLMPYFSMDNSSQAFSVIGCLNLLLPIFQPPPDRPDLHPQKILPTIFYLWSTFAHSRLADIQFMILLCRMACESLESPYVELGEFGIFTEEQSTEIFTSILRSLCLNHSSLHSPFRSGAGASQLVQEALQDARGEFTMTTIARYIVSSMTASCLNKDKSIFTNLEILIQTIKPFYHPSLQNIFISDLIANLCVELTGRWQMELSGESRAPQHKRLSRDIIKRSVILLRELPLIGIFSKSGHDERRALNALEYLAFLEPTLVLPRALRLIYPALQDSSPAHRTKSCIKALNVLGRSMAKTKGFRCHIGFLLGLLLPAIDPNDPSKTRRTLSFIQTISQLIPFHNLQTDYKKLNPDSNEAEGSFLAQQWFQSEMDRFENAPEEFELDYDTELTDQEEEVILRQTTASLEDYVREFVQKLFVLAESMGGAGHNTNVGPDKTESSLASALSLMSLSFFPSLSPELFEVALATVSKNVHNWALQNSKSSVSGIFHAMTLANPARTMAVLYPSFISNIRIEVLENGAGTTRGQDDILPRDQRLVYYIRGLNSMISAGWALKPWVTELRSLFEFLQSHCRGPVNRYVEVLIGNFLGSLTSSRPRETFLFDPVTREKGLTTKDWGCFPEPKSVEFEWYIPGDYEITTAVDTFHDIAVIALEGLAQLTGPSPSVKMDGKSKEWTDEIIKILSLLMDMLKGTSTFVDTDFQEPDPDSNSGYEANGDVTMVDDPLTSADSPAWNDLDLYDKIVGNIDRPCVRYNYGYPLKPGSPPYLKFHRIRHKIGYALHHLHGFLRREAEDNFACSTLVNHVISTYLIDVAISRYIDMYRRYTELYLANQRRFHYSGMRKQMPRSLIITRYVVHHFGRSHHSTVSRTRTQLDVILLNDLVSSSVFSTYRRVRIHAQHLLASPLRIVDSSTVFIINRILTALEESIAKKDLKAVKGAFYTLSLPDIDTRLRHEWQLSARFVRSYLKTFDLDDTKTKLPDVHPELFLNSSSTTFITSKSLYHLANSVIPAPKLATLQTEIKTRIAMAEQTLGGDRHTLRWDFAQELADMLTENKAFNEDSPSATATEWPMKKTALLLTTISANGVWFDHLVSDKIIDYAFAGIVSSVPTVREACGSLVDQILRLLSERAISNFDRKQWLDLIITNPNRKTITIDPTKPKFTEDFLLSMKEQNPEQYVECEYGWLVWPNTIQTMTADPKPAVYPELDTRVRKRIGHHINKGWFDKTLAFAKVEPMSQEDKYQSDGVNFYSRLFQLMFAGDTKITFDELRESVATILEDKDDKNCDRAQSEMMGALVQSVRTTPAASREAVWEYVIPFIREVVSGKARSEVLGYWLDLIDDTIMEADARRAQPVIDLLTDLPKDISPDGMLKRQALFDGLRRIVRLAGWYFELEPKVISLLLDQLTNPYKNIRAIVGTILATHVQSHHHPSYGSLEALYQDQKLSSVGRNPYEPNQALKDLYADVVARLDGWRATHVPNQTEPTDYRNGGKTVLTWIRVLVFSSYCGLVVDLLCGPLFPHLLFMMDVKEDPELLGLSADILLSLPMLPYRAGQDVALVDNIVRVGLGSTSWHHRTHVLALVSTFHYQRQFTLSEKDKDRLLEAVISMLSDTVIDVRKSASSALAAMVQCMPLPKRTKVIADIQARLGLVLSRRIPKVAKAKRSIEEALSPISLEVGPPAKILNTGPSLTSELAIPESVIALNGIGIGSETNTSDSLSTPDTPKETPQAAAIRRHHGAVLGLGSLVLAFPFASPPPRWMPAVLNVLATKAMADTGMVARSAKWFLAEFRKTRQDTWFIDSKAFKGDELVNLEGVVQVSYFA